MNREMMDLNQPRTIICIGFGRTGTTAVASMMEYLGVFIGDEVQPMNLENLKLGHLIESQKLDEATALIADYNRRFPVWAIKRPKLRGQLEHLGLFRNPMLIVTHRDPLGIALRSELSLPDARCDLGELIRIEKLNVDFLTRLLDAKCPQLHISFSTIATAPDDILAEVANFVGVPMREGDFTEHQLQNRERYLVLHQALREKLEAGAIPRRKKKKKKKKAE